VTDSALVLPSVDIRLAGDRHETHLDWLHGRHSFDTGVDPFGRDTHHGVLVVHNHDTIAPGTGFDTHHHRNMEIVTWVLEGSVVHHDSEGHSGAIYRDLAQRMSAGTGIWHSERNDHPVGDPHAGRPLDLVQMWVVPDERGIEPGYEQLLVDTSDLNGRFAVIASGIARHRDDTAIRIGNRCAALHVARLTAGQAVALPDAPYVHLYVARGHVSLEGTTTLTPGDAARMTEAGARRVTALTDSELLAWEMHADLAPR